MNRRFSQYLLIGSFVSGCLLGAGTPIVGSHDQSPIQAPQQIPISYGLVADTSGSVRRLLDQMVYVCKVIVSNNDSNDETFLVRFTDGKNIKRVKDLTRDKATIIEEVDSFYPEGGQTAIIDALYESAQYLAQNSESDDPNRRRALILVTDGEDRGSHQKLDGLLALLREKKIRVYVVGLVTQLEKDRVKKSTSFLGTLANETGGRAFFPRTVPELNDTANEMLGIIRNY